MLGHDSKRNPKNPPVQDSIRGVMTSDCPDFHGNDSPYEIDSCFTKPPFLFESFPNTPQSLVPMQVNQTLDSILWNPECIHQNSLEKKINHMREYLRANLEKSGIAVIMDVPLKMGGRIYS